MTNYVIETSDLIKDHTSPFLRKKFRALDRVTIRVPEGQTYGLLGLNGAGKTTFLKLLLGLLKVTDGQVSVFGHEPGSPKALARIGFLPESPYFYSHLTAQEFLDLVGKLFGMNGKTRKAKSLELLAMVSMAEHAKRPLRKYSKGMLQRLGLAQSLMNDPDILFWDEPTSGLDPIGRRDVRQIILKLKSQGKTIFFNSHLLPDVNEVCDHVGILHRGRLIGEKAITDSAGTGRYQDLEKYFLETIAQADQSRSANS
jgi:ABC-2 type transport system ATP-binding protein